LNWTTFSKRGGGGGGRGGGGGVTCTGGEDGKKKSQKKKRNLQSIDTRISPPEGCRSGKAPKAGGQWKTRKKMAHEKEKKNEVLKTGPISASNISKKGEVLREGGKAGSAGGGNGYRGTQNKNTERRREKEISPCPCQKGQRKEAIKVRMQGEILRRGERVFGGK